MKSKNIFLVTIIAIIVSLSVFAASVEIQANDGSCFFVKISETGNTAQIFTCQAELVHAKELCDSGVDDDNDGSIDCADDDCQHSCKTDAKKGASVLESAVDNLKEKQHAAKAENDPQKRVQAQHKVKEAAENVKTAAEKKEKEVVKHEKQAIDQRGVAAVNNNDYFVASKNDYARISKEAEALIKSVNKDIDDSVGVETEPSAEDCTNNIDDDNDGKIDCADIDCNGLSGANHAQSTVCEYGKELSCNDKFDNDRDGRVAKTSRNEVSVAGKAIKAADVYAAVSASINQNNLGSRGIKITPENFDDVEDTTEVDDVHVFDPCLVIDCYFVQVAEDLALISTPDSMWTADTSDWAAIPTEEGAMAPTAVQEEVANNEIEVTNNVGQSVNINSIANQVNSMGTSTLGNSIIGYAIRDVNIGGGTDCADSDCADDPVCQVATSLLTLGKECGSHAECFSGLCVADARYDEVKVCTEVVTEEVLLANDEVCNSHAACASGFCAPDAISGELKVCTEVVEPAAVCSDTDGGLNYAVKGHITGTKARSNSPIEDVCKDTNLIEVYCNTAGQGVSLTHTCLSGEVCSDGACVVTTATAPACIAGDWDKSLTTCSAECGGGTKTLVYTKNNADCVGDTPEPVVMECNVQSCLAETTPACIAGDWDKALTPCSAECGGGVQTLSYTKNNNNPDCRGDNPGTVEQVCNTQACTTATVLGDNDGDGCYSQNEWLPLQYYYLNEDDPDTVACGNNPDTGDCLTQNEWLPLQYYYLNEDDPNTVACK